MYAWQRHDYLSVGETVLFFGFLAVVCEGLWAALARLGGYDYTALACLGVVLYVAAGFVAARYRSVGAGVRAGMGVALLDATLGWGLAAALGPGRAWVPAGTAEQLAAWPPEVLVGFAAIAVLVMTPLVLFVGALFGAIGAALSRLPGLRAPYFG